MKTPEKLRDVQSCNMSEFVEFDPQHLALLVHTLDKYLPKHMQTPRGTLSIAVMDDAQIGQIHDDYLGDSSPTDVITFDGDADECFAGEICVSAQMALSACAQYNNTPDSELCLYVAHGMLHLAGIDDIAPEDAAKMREAEAEAMKIVVSHFNKPIFKFKE